MAKDKRLTFQNLILTLQNSLASIPEALSPYQLELSGDGELLIYTFHAEREQSSIARLLRELHDLGIEFKDLRTRESSLEEIFVSLVSARS